MGIAWGFQHAKMNTAIEKNVTEVPVYGSPVTPQVDATELKDTISPKAPSVYVEDEESKPVNSTGLDKAVDDRSLCLHLAYFLHGFSAAAIQLLVDTICHQLVLPARSDCNHWRRSQYRWWNLEAATCAIH